MEGVQVRPRSFIQASLNWLSKVRNILWQCCFRLSFWESEEPNFRDLASPTEALPIALPGTHSRGKGNSKGLHSGMDLKKFIFLDYGFEEKRNVCVAGTSWALKCLFCDAFWLYTPSISTLLGAGYCYFPKDINECPNHGAYWLKLSAVGEDLRLTVWSASRASALRQHTQILLAWFWCLQFCGSISWCHSGLALTECSGLSLQNAGYSCAYMGRYGAFCC